MCVTAAPEAQTPLTHFEEFSLSGLRALSGLLFIGVLGPQGVELGTRHTAQVLDASPPARPHPSVNSQSTLLTLPRSTRARPPTVL